MSNSKVIVAINPEQNSETPEEIAKKVAKATKENETQKISGDNDQNIVLSFTDKQDEIMQQRSCFFTYYYKATEQEGKVRENLLMQLINQPNCITFFANLKKDLELGKNSGLIYSLPHLGITATLQNFQSNFWNKSYNHFSIYIDFDKHNKGLEVFGKWTNYNRLKKFIKANITKSVAGENNNDKEQRYTKHIKNLLKSVKNLNLNVNDQKNQIILLLLDNFERALIQLMYESDLALTINDIWLLRKSFIKSISDINQEGSGIFAIAGVTPMGSIKGSCSLLEKWEDVSIIFSGCFFDVVAKNKKYDAKSCNCGSHDKCEFTVKKEEFNLGKKRAERGWCDQLRIQKVNFFCNYNPYWIIDPIVKISGRTRSTDKDELIKTIYKNDDYILKDFIQMLPFFIGKHFESVAKDFKVESIEKFNNALISIVKNILEEYKAEINNWITSSYKAFIENHDFLDISIQLNKTNMLNLIKRNFDNDNLFINFSDINYKSLIDAIIDTLTCSKVIEFNKDWFKNETIQITRMHRYFAYVYSDFKIYEKVC